MFDKKKIVIAFALLSLTSAVGAADSNAGKSFFRAQCALCHSAEAGDNGGAQGPNLEGVFGREAGSGGNYPYSAALRAADLVWDAEALDHFLAEPTVAVPGTSMVVAVLEDEARENVIAYFEALASGTFEEEQPSGQGFGGFGASPDQEPPAGEADWVNDYPGRVHRIDLSTLPEPLATPSAVNFPQVIERPEGAELAVPEGFKVDIFATDLQAPRDMLVAENGDILIVETQEGRIKVMQPSVDGRRAESISIYAQGLVQPLGMAFYPSAESPEWLYVAEMNRVVRYSFSIGDRAASGVPEVVVAQLSPVGGGHYTRGLAFSRDGSQMFVSVGSQSNVAEDITKKASQEVAEWETEYGLGAPWGLEERRASVLVFDVDSPGEGRLWATGLRNCVGLTVQQLTGDLWCAVNERDQLGDDLVPDYATRVNDGDFFGWPWYYMGDNEDPRLAGHRPDLVGKIRQPDVPFTSHSAAVSIAFYPESDGDSAFPEEYVGQGFAVLHGSWNRAHRTGHKVVQIPIENGEPTGEYIDFLTGFIAEDGNAWGRPVAITVAQDGSLLLSDDGTGIVYRISYGD